MHTTTLPVSIFSRVLAIHKAAADRERTSANLDSVHLCERNGKIVIEATDGKFLIRETFDPDAHDGMDVCPGLDMMLGTEAVKSLAPLTKSKAKALRMTPDGLLTVTDGAMTVQVKTTEGSYVSVENALKRTVAETMPASFGLSGDYLARFEKLWGGGIRFDFDGSGFRVSPMNRLPWEAVGILMPITLPK